MTIIKEAVQRRRTFAIISHPDAGKTTLTEKLLLFGGAIKLAGTVDIETVSDGLYQKMISSGGGLVVGVIAFIGFQWLSTRVDKLAHRMEESQIAFLDILNEPSK